MFTATHEITRKQLRSFGLTVGGIFALMAVWPVAVRAEDPRWWALVLALCLVLPAAMFPRGLVWPYTAWMALGVRVGLDQHANYSWGTFLSGRDSDWSGAPLVGKRPNGPKIETRSRQLSYLSSTPTAFSLDPAILKFFVSATSIRIVGAAYQR